ncbi:MAG TPA: transglycosylase domain-containing protein [Saprospiraceae bacterium]|nr:transglycosylase domain-containing protein [Saprospiraceae bacterium]
MTENQIEHTIPLQFQKYNRYLRNSALAVLGLVILIFVFIGFSDLPTFEDLENPKYDLATVIYDVHGVPFGRYYIEDRVAIDYPSLNPHVKNALILTEDERFFSHSGIDLRALARVGFKTLLFRQENSGGGSTITQQLAKQLFSRPKMSDMSAPRKILTLIGVKLKEWVTAVKLEKSYTKEEIMVMYLNKFEFINGAHGIEAAAQIYFNKSQKDLNVEEAATLVGMLKNPSLYNPKRFPEKCKIRRDLVLNLMHNADQIDKAALDTLIVKDIDMSLFDRKTQSDGPAPYFRAELTKWLKSLLETQNIKKADGTPYNIYTDGLKVYTTIDLNYQKHAEAAVVEHMRKIQKKYFRIWKNMDPWTFEADDAQKQLRADILEGQNKGSERYLKLREKMIASQLGDVEQKYAGLPMSDNVIKTLITISQNKTSWREATNAGKIDISNQDRYHRLLNSDIWQPLVTSYDKLQEVYQKEFSTPIKMKIFDYEKGGEKEVEMSPFDSVRYHKMIMQAGFLVLESNTGHIKSWVGGIDHKYFKFDHATMRRSVGSTMKPFVYTQAIAVQGISPCQEFDDIQYTIAPGDAGFEVNQEWSPANANEEFTGNKYNLFHGLLYSKNSITVRLLKEMGTVALVRDLMHNLGIDKNLRLEGGRLAIPNSPSICLGAVDLTLMEMTGAYSAFGNNGTYVQPIFVSRIEDKNGKIIYQGIPNRKTAINPLYNAVMLEMLKNNVGGQFSLNIKTKIGGKTGTTNDYADGWFMGVTPNLITGVWSGGDDKWIRFLDLNDGQGYVMARPISELFFQKLEKDETSGYDYKANFPTPPAGFAEMIDCEKYKYIRPADERRTLLKDKLKNEEFDEEF